MTLRSPSPYAPRVVLEQVVGVGAAQHRVQEPAVEVAVVDPRRVLVAGRRRVHRREVERDPDAPGQRRHGQPVREQQVVADGQRGRPVAQPGREAALCVAGEGHHPRLVVRDPGRHEVAELARHVVRVVGEALRRVAVGPAARVLQGLREVPVVERGGRFDPALEQSLDELAIEAHARRIERPGPVGLHPRPRDREAVGLQAERRHEVEVLAPAVVVVAGDLAGVAVLDGAGNAAEGVPDRVAAPVLMSRALDLVGRGGRAEAKSRWKAGHGSQPIAEPGRRRLGRAGANSPTGADGDQRPYRDPLTPRTTRDGPGPPIARRRGSATGWRTETLT
jgi:hypothetical protein